MIPKGVQMITGVGNDPQATMEKSANNSGWREYSEVVLRA
jgi:hypothetical protein